MLVFKKKQSYTSTHVAPIQEFVTQKFLSYFITIVHLPCGTKEAKKQNGEEWKQSFPSHKGSTPPVHMFSLCSFP